MSEEMKWTKGPWRKKSDGGDREIISADGESLLCDTPYYPWCPDKEEDWDLISAAPQLYEALEKVLEHYIEHHAYCSIGYCGQVCDCGRDQTVTGAKAALAKARGE